MRQTWEALSQGNLSALEAALAPDAKWRAVEDGPWNCQNRARILEVMGHNLENGLAGEIEEVLDAGARAVVAFRPRTQVPGAWPLDNGIRYVVLTERDGLISEMKGCADRKTALAYAGIG